MPNQEKEMPQKSDVINPKLISTGLRVAHIDSNLHYTVVSVNERDKNVVLKPPTGEMFSVSFEEMEEEYALD